MMQETEQGLESHGFYPVCKIVIGRSRWRTARTCLCQQVKFFRKPVGEGSTRPQTTRAHLPSHKAIIPEKDARNRTAIYNHTQSQFSVIAH